LLSVPLPRGLGTQSEEALEPGLKSTFVLTGTKYPSTDAAKEEPIEIGAAAVPGTSIAVSFAMTPLPIIFVLDPTARQMNTSAFRWHTAVFPDDISAAPSSTVRF
jgi:hypothetical protein